MPENPYWVRHHRSVPNSEQFSGLGEVDWKIWKLRSLIKELPGVEEGEVTKDLCDQEALFTSQDWDEDCE